MTDKELQKNLKIIKATGTVLAMAIASEILNSDSKYCELLGKLDFEVDPFLETAHNKLVLECKGKNPVYTLEEELCIYSFLHVSAAYTYVEDFITILNRLMSKTQPITKEQIKIALESFYASFTENMTDIENKLYAEKDFIERKKELNKYVPMQKLYTIDF